MRHQTPNETNCDAVGKPCQSTLPKERVLLVQEFQAAMYLINLQEEIYTSRKNTLTIRSVNCGIVKSNTEAISSAIHEAKRYCAYDISQCNIKYNVMKKLILLILD
ncbi:hypothetical protein WN51_12699 [Melipona quadrifasciata]|uniref:Uncharacterized protein n=1 Tax=Melipona quadrifasciata TaxID=166423 RepID=A0A0N0BGT4_9HYME|nr:hypothetical protein WN51_12699 [Melipona quadrifasciata]